MSKVKVFASSRRRVLKHIHLFLLFHIYPFASSRRRVLKLDIAVFSLYSDRFASSRRRVLKHDYLSQFVKKNIGSPPHGGVY